MTPDAQPAKTGAPFSADGAVVSYDRFLRPEPARVVLRPFVPAENGKSTDATGPARVEQILDRVLALSEAELKEELERVLKSLAGRHRNVEQVLQRRFYEMADRFVCGRTVSPSQTLLVGSYFTEEYSFEAAALFNPSIVAHPDQSGVAPGAIRFLMSLRAIGEGHISSITFRTGSFAADGKLTIDPPSPWAVSPQIEYVPGGAADDPGLRLFCGEHDDLSQLVIFPVTYRQRHGIEDLRLVRFTDDDGHSTYLGTYTAFSGEAIRQELLRTEDFKTFELSALLGPLSATKGMALFPRRIDGRYAMLGRHDHENIWLLKSDDLANWGTGEIIVSPRWPWEYVQIGICSSPIELDEGWLLITHGVGPIRNYCLGACLLDKRDPTKVITRSRHPLLRPCPEMRDGYVPNVVYSCGALVLGRTLLLPYGVADTFTAFATIALDPLLQSMG
jgi:predicted GH43/DUF377 family glycosyl hydrolase